MEDVPPLGQLANSYAEVERLLAGRQWERGGRAAQPPRPLPRRPGRASSR